jgi:DNA-binding transcriptional regulator YiaG
MQPHDIRRLRKRLNLTQQQLADKIGAQRASVARWEIGLHQPRGANLKALKELIVKSKKKKK